MAHCPLSCTEKSYSPSKTVFGCCVALDKCDFWCCVVLLKLHKEYLNLLKCKSTPYSRWNTAQFDVWNTFLCHAQKKLFTVKNSPVFFGPPCIKRCLWQLKATKQQTAGTGAWYGSRGRPLQVWYSTRSPHNRDHDGWIFARGRRSSSLSFTVHTQACVCNRPACNAVGREQRIAAFADIPACSLGD